MINVESIQEHCAPKGYESMEPSTTSVHVIRNQDLRWGRCQTLPGRPRRRWMDNVGMDLQEVGCGYMNWIGLAQDRDRWWTLVSAVMNLRVP